ncbi:hypothetical protein [Myxococcus qinghaiensis]|uniref:hypothetical protein n=1 Tax=Myxococcus qinghaiensis TaxID=2906758 RepID=UPI0020A7EBE2|nr:hypothetical protein [Myxococcus qinghaiensis]MCP3168107.1 hypothetical protein [Myxococcus qinghaiensis]
MSKEKQSFLTVLLSLVLVPGVLLLVSAVTGGAFPVGVALLLGLPLGLGYGLQTGLLRSYPLSSAQGWVELLVDLTWSLPNTLFGFVFGNLVYVFFGRPSRADSENQGWVVYRPNPGGSFGHNVLQTLGTVNLGGAGQHEKMHLLQARIFGPFYLPFVAASYVITSLLQLLWTCTVGGLLKLLGMRDKAYLRPPAHSAVGGFFGWIYYATPIELWAYATGNP